MLEHLKNLPIWVAWRRETRDGKTTKVPYTVRGSLASTSDPRSWSSFHTVNSLQNKDGIGIVFEPENRIVGIDFDHVFDDEKTTLELPNWLEDFIEVANSYCEFSPSKTGCHILFQLTDRLELIANKTHFDDISCVEIYTSGRYFTFTENTLPQSKDLRLVTPDEFTALISRLGYPWKKQKKEFVLSSDSSFQKEEEIPDQEILKRMFASKNGSHIQALFNGDLSKNENNKSSADFSLCLHLAFWTRKNASQMERLWLSSLLASREKTQERGDYRERTIQNAIEAVETVYSPSPVTSLSSDPSHDSTKDNSEIEFHFSTGKNPKPLLSFPNVVKILEKDPELKERFRRNDYSHLTETNLKQEAWSPITDESISHTRFYVTENYADFRMLSNQMMTEGILKYSYSNTVNPPRDYVTSLKWDETPRLNSWLHHVYGVPDDELHQAIGSNWMKGLVKRIMIPGCQFDEVLALESPQGHRKSSSIRALGEPWHVETTHSIDSKDFYLMLAQNVIVEFSEGDIFDRASMKRLKAEITKTEDQVRPPYERGIVKFKRSCVFAVTTNCLELKDDTGNRRWLPVKLQKIADVEWIIENRDQMYAEAFHRVMVLKESTHEYPKEALEELQESRTEDSGYDEATMMWFASLLPEVRDDGILLHQAIEEVMKKIDGIQKRDEILMSSILKKTLYLEKRDKKIDGVVRKRWFPTAKTLNKIKEIPTKSFYDRYREKV